MRYIRLQNKIIRVGDIVSVTLEKHYPPFKTLYGDEKSVFAYQIIINTIDVLDDLIFDYNSADNDFANSEFNRIYEEMKK